MRAAPTVWEMGVMVHTWTAGIPAFSICLTSVAPQRVQVPQVLVRMTAFTLASRSSWAMSRPMEVADVTEVELPVVTK